MKRKQNSKILKNNSKLRFFSSLLIFSAALNPYLNAQQFQSSNRELNLNDTCRKIENVISMWMPGHVLERIRTVSGEKIIIRTFRLIINGDTQVPDVIKTRGQTSLNFRRKSYSFSLKSNPLFRHGERTASFSKFLVISLSMDKDYFNNHIAFEMLDKLQLFDLFHSFCELRINAHSVGIYMIIEQPENWAMKIKGSSILIRRGYEHTINKRVIGKQVTKDEAKVYTNYFNQIYEFLQKYKGAELYKALSERIDIKAYMKWLAFNFLVHNSDYTDEVYFYIDQVTNKFSIIPWDYDDLFSEAPHEGIIERKKNVADKLIFSVEDQLDRMIAYDPYLYNNYLLQFREVLKALSSDFIKRVFEDTFAELYPYYSNSEIIGMSQYDLFRETNLIKLKNDMANLYEQLLLTKNQYLIHFESMNSGDPN